MASSPKIDFTQTVELEVTVLFQLKPHGADKTKVFAWPAYFVKRSSWGMSSSGKSTPAVSETISILSSKGAAFKDSTRCCGTYQMEKDMLTFISAIADLPEP